MKDSNGHMIDSKPKIYFPIKNRVEDPEVNSYNINK